MEDRDAGPRRSCGDSSSSHRHGQCRRSCRADHHGGDGPFWQTPNSFPPALLLRRVKRLVKTYTPVSVLTDCGNFFTSVLGAGLQGKERVRAQYEAALVTHLAAALLILEVGHAARLGYSVYKRQARAEQLRRQRHSKAKEEEEERMDASQTTTTTTTMTAAAATATSQPWTGVGSSAAVSTTAEATEHTTAAAATAATTSPDSESADSGSAAKGREEDAAEAEEEEEEDLLAASPVSGAPRGHRLVHYWQLIESAVDSGSCKSPSPSVPVDDILPHAEKKASARSAATNATLSASMTAAAATAALNGSNPNASGDAVLVLPDAFSFVVSPLARKYLSAPCKSTPTDKVVRWLTLYLLWTDTVRYSVNTGEIRKLLLSYPSAFYKDLATAAAAAEAVEHTSGTVVAATETEARHDSRGTHGAEKDFASATSAPAAMVLQEAAANLAIAWRLTLTRRVYDALVVHEDTQRCADDVEELETYGEDIYRRCIAPWQEAHGKGRRPTSPLSASPLSPPQAAGATGQRLITCSPPRAWLHLGLALQQLRRVSRRLTVRSVGSLFRYMYASSKSKCIAAAMLTLLTGLTSRVTSAGMLAREAVTQTLGGFYYGGGGGRERDRERGHTCGGHSHHDAGKLFLTQMLSLCSFELIRLAVNTVLMTSSKQFIGVTASQRRDAVKAQLYEALTHMPLSFFDLHSYDEIEEMVYFVNDLEGVDVHVHQYAFTSATAFVAARLALAPLSRQARWLVFGTVAASYTAQWLGAAVARSYNRLKQPQQQGGKGGRDGVCVTVLKSLMGISAAPPAAPDPELATDSGDGHVPPSFAGDAAAAASDCGEVRDAQEAENVSSANSRDGIMLRGLEIVAALPQLRPYGADVSLMAWWNNYVTARSRGAGGGAKQGGLLAVFVRDAHGQLVPALGNALLSFVDWFLPLFTSVYGAHTATRCQDAGPATASGRLLDATNAVKSAVEAVFDARRVLGVVLSNSYKACVLERILSPRFWESTAAEDIERVGAYAAAHSWDDAMVKPPPVALYRRLTHQHADTLRAATAAAHSKKTYENLMVTRVSVRGLQFAYPSNPTVPVFTHPLSAEMVLQDPKTGRGRFVCITGPSGQGKSTILHLLLGLYTSYARVGGGHERASPLIDVHSPIELRLAYKGGTSSPTLDPPAPAEREGADTPASSPPGMAASFGEEEEYPVSLREIPCGVLRGELFSYVPQYPTIFAGATIAHNITLSPFISIEETALLAKAQACADEAKCDYIRRFPQGLLTPVGDASSLWSGAAPAGGGLVRLSGGQAQRLMVARALYHGGGILLMDEPTASLDAATKSELLAEWRQLLNRGVIKGIICATHDEVVVAAADEVISLAQGEG